VKESFELLNYEFVLMVSSSLIVKIREIAIFRSELKDLSRGKYYYSDNPDKTMQ
jgi:hypothetical protein